MKKELIIIACLTGFLGDGILQVLSKYTSGWGLKPYFKQHGSIESLFIAGGMMALFFIIYDFTGLPINWFYLGIYGVLLDLLFRKTMLFPSLKGYYNHLNYFESAIWGAIPAIIPLLIMKIIS